MLQLVITTPPPLDYVIAKSTCEQVVGESGAKWACGAKWAPSI